MLRSPRYCIPGQRGYFRWRLGIVACFAGSCSGYRNFGLDCVAPFSLRKPCPIVNTSGASGNLSVLVRCDSQICLRVSKCHLSSEATMHGHTTHCDRLYTNTAFGWVSRCPALAVQRRCWPIERSEIVRLRTLSQQQKIRERRSVLPQCVRA